MVMSGINVSINLIGTTGEPFGKLRLGALELIAEAEGVARRDNLAKTSAITKVLRTYVESSGHSVTDIHLKEAIHTLNRVRSGEPIREVLLTVSSRQVGRDKVMEIPSALTPLKNTIPMSSPTTPSAAISFFESEREFPDPDAQVWYTRLVGLDEQKERLLVELEMLLFPEQVEAWSKEHHGKLLQLWQLYQNRVPLILFEGDVGTGKTALAETVGDALARRIPGKKKVHLLKLNTQVRGTGLVGEMSDLIAQAFTQAEARTRALRGAPVLLLIDEADALAASRDTQQMHHEDKAGLNTVLQRLDNLRITKLPIAVLFITNRPEALDPAIRRRAALDLHFERPTDEIREKIITSAVPEIPISATQLAELVKLTGSTSSKNHGIGFTASDITDRLLPSALRTAFTQKRALTVTDLIEQAKLIEATPKFGGTT